MKGSGNYLVNKILEIVSRSSNIRSNASLQHAMVAHQLSQSSALDCPKLRVYYSCADFLLSPMRGSFLISPATDAYILIPSCSRSTMFAETVRISRISLNEGKHTQFSYCRFAKVGQSVLRRINVALSFSYLSQDYRLTR